VNNDQTDDWTYRAIFDHIIEVRPEWVIRYEKYATRARLNHEIVLEPDEWRKANGFVDEKKNESAQIDCSPRSDVDSAWE
jgi:hypothetical protein